VGARLMSTGGPDPKPRGKPLEKERLEQGTKTSRRGLGVAKEKKGNEVWHRESAISKGVGKAEKKPLKVKKGGGGVVYGGGGGGGIFLVRGKRKANTSKQ